MDYQVPHEYMKRLIELAAEEKKNIYDYLDEIIEDHIESIVLGRMAEESLRELEESGEVLPTAEECYQNYLRRRAERDKQEQEELEKLINSSKR